LPSTFSAFLGYLFVAAYVPCLYDFLKNIHFLNVAEEFYRIIFSNFFLTFKDEICSKEKNKRQKKENQ
jgi:hypothetical protein